MKVTVLLFAMARELVDSSSIELELPDEANIKTLTAALVNEYPALSSVMKTAMLAVNRKFVDDGDEDVVLTSKDEIAVIPPVSGG